MAISSVRKYFKIFGVHIFFCLVGCKYATPETYLIPKGFKGRVYIVFNVANRKKTEIQNGHRLYQIPDNGILLTRSENVDGIIDHGYYYVDIKGKKTPLRVYDYVHDSSGRANWVIADSAEIGIFEDGTSGSYGNPGVPYENFVVSSLKNLDSFRTDSARDLFFKKLDAELSPILKK